jgi:hypothetical protein
LTHPCPFDLGHTKVKTSLTNFMDKIGTQKIIKKKKFFYKISSALQDWEPFSTDTDNKDKINSKYLLNVILIH